jgi:SWI/SNF-related matrix-associated actin-dependent regulator of chromatin subfamily A3
MNMLNYAIGVLTAKIVGVQYYKGHATEGEFVIIRREPTNPVDKLPLNILLKSLF